MSFRGRGIGLCAALAIVAVAGCSTTTHYNFDGSVAAGFGATPGTTPAAPAGIGPIPTVDQALPAIESFVEKERGLKFKHAVKVKLLGSKAFVKKLDQGDKGPSKKDLNQAYSVFASLGLISPKVDIAKAFKTAGDDGTLGFYDFKSKRLYVRGTRATPGVRAVMAHELTHALTDQWFGLNRPKLDKSNQELGDGFTGLIEGDAERTRIAYEHQVLTPDQRKIAEKEENGGGRPPHVPLVVLEEIGFPYAVGPTFVDAIVTDEGLKGLNRAYRHPPTSSEQLIDPIAYENHDNPKHVATPHPDGTRVAHGDLGMIGLLLMLEKGLTREHAQSSITGWGGDQFASWRTGTHSWCLRDSVVMDYGIATSNFQAGLKAWVASRHGRARIEHLGNKTTFVTCSNGSSAPTV